MIQYSDYMPYIPLLRVWTSTDAQINIVTNLNEAPVYVNNNFIGYGNASYGVVPNNSTSNPYYIVRFGEMVGYKTPKSAKIILGYGNIATITGFYTLIVAPAPFSLLGFDFSMIASGIFIPGLLIGVISGGFYIAGRKLEHAWAGALIGAAMALGLMGYFQVVPIYIIGLIYAIGGFLIYYLWWKRR